MFDVAFFSWIFHVIVKHVRFEGMKLNMNSGAVGFWLEKYYNLWNRLRKYLDLQWLWLIYYCYYWNFSPFFTHLWKTPHSWTPVCSRRWRTEEARCASRRSRRSLLLSSRILYHLLCNRLQTGTPRTRHSLIHMSEKALKRAVASFCYLIMYFSCSSENTGA